MIHAIEVYDADDILLERWTFPTRDEYMNFCSGMNLGIRYTDIKGAKIQHSSDSQFARVGNPRVKAIA
jgi:hypothetical protein